MDITIEREVPGRPAEVRDGIGYSDTLTSNDLVYLGSFLDSATLRLIDMNFEDLLWVFCEVGPRSLVRDCATPEDNEPIC